MIYFILILVVLLILAMLIGIEGLVYWGIGAFVCWAFQIPFEFTFFHGLAVAMVIPIISGIFKSDTIRIKLDDIKNLLD